MGIHPSRCWWFVVDNQSDDALVTYDQILPFIDGSADDFFWPHGGSPWTLEFYSAMRVGDRVVLWMDAGDDSPAWGIQGFATILRIEGQPGTEGSRYVLRRQTPLIDPFTPYPSGRPQDSPELAFLRAIFREDYKPLAGAFGLGSSEVTVFPVKPWQYEALLDRTLDRAA